VASSKNADLVPNAPRSRTAPIAPNARRKASEAIARNVPNNPAEIADRVPSAVNAATVRPRARIVLPAIGLRAKAVIVPHRPNVRVAKNVNARNARRAPNPPPSTKPRAWSMSGPAPKPRHCFKR
jgi:hypothetical protein